MAIFIEIKYAPGEFLPTLLPLCEKYHFSPRMLEATRSKMRRIGIVDHVSRFNKANGYREGWVFSNRFFHSMNTLSTFSRNIKQRKDARQEEKDRDLFRYL